MMMIALNTLVNFTGPTKTIDTADQLTIKISGMTCNHCTKTIEKGIKSMGISDVDVDLDSSDYSDDTPVIIQLGKLKEIVDQVLMEFDGMTYNEFVEKFKD